MVRFVRLIFLLMVFVSLGATQLENGPTYDDIVFKFSQSLIQNITSPIVDFRSIIKSKDYLDYQRQIFGRYSANPLLLDAVRQSSLLDVCTWLDPGISNKCCTDLRTVFMSLLAKEMWAIKMIDSCGKLPSGILLGDTFFPGSFDECLNLTAVYKSVPNGVLKHFNTKYCQIGINIPKLTGLILPECKAHNPCRVSSGPKLEGGSWKLRVAADSRSIMLVAPTTASLPNLQINVVFFSPQYLTFVFQFNPKGLLTIGICVPDSCHASDIKFIFNTESNKFTKVPKLVKALSIRRRIIFRQSCVKGIRSEGTKLNARTFVNLFDSKTKKIVRRIEKVKKGISLLTFWFGGKDHTFVCHEEQTFNIQAIVSLSVCGLIVVLLIVGTVYDVIGRQLAKLARLEKLAKLQKTKAPPTDRRQQPGGTDSLEMTTIQSTPTPKPDDEQMTTTTTQLEPTQQPSREPGKVGRFLICFSLSKNTRKLLNSDLPKDSLTPVHGVRFLSMTWIILGHTYIFGISFWRNPNFFLKKVISFQFQAIGNATVSVDSFFLISGLLVVYIGLKTLKEETGNKDWLFYYVHRFWRLTPTYMLVMLIYIPLMQYWGNGPYWPQKGFEPNYCRHNWWQNLLYINNFFDKQCMGWMWYLANDMQFYIISPIFLLLLNKKPVRGFILMLLMLIGQFLITSFTWTKKPRDPRFDNPLEIYMRPYNRIGPYLVGMAYGYLLHRINCKMTINRFLSVLLWFVAAACGVSVLYGRYGNFHDDLMTKEEAATYMAVHRSVWAVALGWVICACVTGYGGVVNRFLSWKAFVPLSRLTYCAYLVHPIVIFTYYLRQRFPIYVTHFQAVHLYFGNLCVSYLIAFVVSTGVEAPVIALEKMLYRKKTTETTTL